MPHITIIEINPAGGVFDTQAATLHDLDRLSNPQLLSIHNEALGRTTSKFASRPKALSQTWAALVTTSTAVVDMRSNPPLLSIAGAAGPQVPPAPVVDPSPSISQRGRGRPVTTMSTWKARKLADGTYEFNMPPRHAKAEPGGRRPELIIALRKGPTFRQLQKAFAVKGDTSEVRAFNLASHITCMCHVTGYGIISEAGRLVLLDPVSS